MFLKALLQAVFLSFFLKIFLNKFMNLVCAGLLFLCAQFIILFMGFLKKHRQTVLTLSAIIILAVLLCIPATFAAFVGVFGYFIFGYLLCAIVLLGLKLKKVALRVNKKRLALYIPAIFFVLSTAHLLFAGKAMANAGFNAYVTGAYDNYTLGGVIFSLLTSPVVVFCKYTASIVIFFLAASALGFFIFLPLFSSRAALKKKLSDDEAAKQDELTAYDRFMKERIEPPKLPEPLPELDPPPSAEKSARDILLKKPARSEIFNLRDASETYDVRPFNSLSASEKLFGGTKKDPKKDDIADFSYGVTRVDAEDAKRKLFDRASYKKTEEELVLPKSNTADALEATRALGETIGEGLGLTKYFKPEVIFQSETPVPTVFTPPQRPAPIVAPVVKIVPKVETQAPITPSQPPQNFDTPFEEDDEEEFEEDFAEDFHDDFSTPKVAEPSNEELDEDTILIRGQSKSVLRAPYKKPPFDLLGDYRYNDVVENYDELKDVFEVQMKHHKLNLTLIDAVKGPTVTLCTLSLGLDCKLSSVYALKKNITLALKAPREIVIVDQLGSSGFFGIEIPHTKPGIVGFKSIVTSREYREFKGEIAIALGRLSNGDLLIEDIAEMPHALIAGSTGSGKSVCINVILTSILYRYSPDEIRLMLIDLKGVELTSYNNIPHMLLKNALTDTKEIMNALAWLRAETTRRYELFKGKYRKLDEYNAEAKDGYKLPRILVIIDEASELMEDRTYGKIVEDTLGSLARIARAAGIHLLFATQNPVKTVITNEIQNNLNTKIAFAVGEYTHSQVIFKANGAESLLGKGDMLIKRNSLKRRAQCAYVDSVETARVTQYVKDNNEYDFDERFIKSVLSYDKDKGAKQEAEEEARRNDELRRFERPVQVSFPDTRSVPDGEEVGKVKRADSTETEAQALKYCVLEQRCSISWLQRKLSASFNVVATVVERLEKMGYIGKAIAGQKNRVILITPQEYNELYPDNPITSEELSNIAERNDD